MAQLSRAETSSSKAEQELMERREAMYLLVPAPTGPETVALEAPEEISPSKAATPSRPVDFFSKLDILD